MNKRKINHYYNKIKHINPLLVLILSIIFFAIGVYSLRQNNLTAIRLRDNVIAADKENKDVETPLRILREYVYSHMNADLSSETSIQQPIQLKYRYERLVQEEKSRVEAVNAKIYTDAQSYCEKQFPRGFFGQGRIPCIQNYITQHGSGITEQPIPDSLYKFNFIAPFWSSDLAGMSLLIASFLFVIFAGLWIIDYSMKKNLESKF